MINAKWRGHACVAFTGWKRGLLLPGLSLLTRDVLWNSEVVMIPSFSGPNILRCTPKPCLWGVDHMSTE